MEDIVQIRMDESKNHTINESDGTVAATLRYGDVTLKIHNGVDKYILYILMKELREHVG